MCKAKHSRLFPIIISLFIILLFAKSVFAEKVPEDKSGMFGKPAPEFTAKTITGENISSSNMKGNVVIVCFWDSDVESTTTLFRKFDAINEKYKGIGVKFVTVSLDADKGKAEKSIEEGKISQPVIWDEKGWNGKLVKLFNIAAIPRIIIIDKEWKINYSSLRGKEITAAVVSLLGEPDMGVTTAAIGSTTSTLDKTNITTNTKQNNIPPVKNEDLKTTATAGKVLNILDLKK